MASQDPEDWELPLTQVPVQFSQPSISRRRLRDEEQPFERHTQPRLDPGPQQAPLVSLRSLHPGHRLYLQGPLNHLGSERRASYIASVLRQILEFLHV